MKPNSQWGLQDIGDAKTVGHFMRKAVETEWRWPKRETCMLQARVVEERLSEVMGAQMRPSKACRLGVEHQGSLLA